MSTIVLARAVTVIPGAGLCRIVGPGFDSWAMISGGSHGVGVRNSGGITPGTRVIAKLGIGIFPGVILQTLRPQTLSAMSNFEPYLIADPPVSGYYEGGLLRKAFKSGVWRTTEQRVDGFMDLVAGEWSKISTFGAYANVEMFRAAMGAGPMSSVEFYTDTQLTRLRGLELDQETLATESHQHRLWNSLERTWRDWWTPLEATQPGWRPRRLTISGPIHEGSQKFVGPATKAGTARPALFHEFTGQDGTHVLTSASALILQRVVDLDMPDEISVVSPGAQQAQIAAALTAPRPEPGITGALNALTTAQGAQDLIDGITRYWARNGVDRVTQQWSTAQVTPVPAAPEYTPEMWGQLPTPVYLNIDGQGHTKKFYVGRSTVALLPDGSVLIENSGQAQILLAGPNIILTAPGEIIQVCGGNHEVISGGSAVLRAQGNVQLAANTGRVDVKAERQLSLLGGNNGGDEGVLIESRATALESKAGVGAQGAVGGIMLKSASGIFSTAPEIGLHAEANLTLVSDGVFQIDAGAIAARVNTGLIMATRGDETPLIEIGEFQGRRTLWFNGTTAFGGDVIATGDALIEGNVIAGKSMAAAQSVVGSSVGEAGTDPQTKQTLDQQIQGTIRTINAALAQFTDNAAPVIANLETTLNQNVPLTSAKAKQYGFSFLTTTDLGVVSYGLPEMRWQRTVRGKGPTWQENYVRDPGGSQPGMPLPGFQAWTASGKYFRAPDAVFFDPVTAAFTPGQPGQDLGIPAATPASLADFIRSPHA